MGLGGSLRRTPLSATRLDHVRVVDAGARVDYLLRTWPDPRLFRRDWAQADWLEFEPPWMDIRAWARDEAFWTVRCVRPRRSRSRSSPAQLDLPFEEVGPRVLEGGFRAFVRSIPREVADAIAAFRHGQYPLLRLLARHPRAHDLIESNPALTMCLTDVDAFCSKRIYGKERRIEELLAMRQRDALQWIGFPGTDSARKILRKVPRERISVYLLLQLRGALTDPTADALLRHCPSIHRGTLALVCDPDCLPRVTPALLHEVATSDGEDERAETRTASVVREIASLQRLLGLDATPMRVTSRQDASRLHDALTEQYLRLGIRQRREIEERRRRRAEEEDRRAEEEHRRADLAAAGLAPAARAAPRAPAPAIETPPPARRRKPRLVASAGFPSPPIEPPGDGGPLRAEPVRTRVDLTQWAERQQNCCASPRYVRRLQEGRLVLYRLKLGCEEATLSLARARGGWMREEFKGPRNRPPSKEMQFLVGRWLQRRGVWVPASWLS